MIIRRQEDVTTAVVAAFEATADPRLREILIALVRHLHAFARATGRHQYRPAHLHFLIFKEGFKTLISQVYVNDDERLESDVQFGVTRALIGDYVNHDGPAPAPDVQGEWYSLDQIFVMEPGKSRLPNPPIR